MVKAAAETTQADLEVDLALLLFVMQFAIEKEALRLLDRLPDDAVIMANLITRDPALIERRLRQLADLGFFVQVLDLEVTGSHDRLILAGRADAERRLADARTAALEQTMLEWPSLTTAIRWQPINASIAHRKNVR
jgi:hypothetical protein